MNHIHVFLTGEAMVEISSDEDVDPNDVPSVFNNQPSGFVVAPREKTKAIPVPPLTAVSSSVVCCRSPLREIHPYADACYVRLPLSGDSSVHSNGPFSTRSSWPIKRVSPTGQTYFEQRESPPRQGGWGPG